VTRIAATIAEVATQTNILAINVAIEAAHAGEHSCGLSVVTEGVRLVAALHRIGQSNATAAEEITVTMIDLSRLAGDTRCMVESLAMTEESPAS